MDVLTCLQAKFLLVLLKTVWKGLYILIFLLSIQDMMCRASRCTSKRERSKNGKPRSGKRYSTRYLRLRDRGILEKWPLEPIIVSKGPHGTFSLMKK